MKIGKYDIRRDNVGSWPTFIRVGLLVLLAVVLLFVAYWFDFSRMLNKNVKLKREESTLKVSLAQKQQLAVNLPAYQKQLTEAQADLQSLMNQLPTKAEMPGLIEEISKLGQANGLSFDLLEPMQEKTLKYYVQLPLHIIVKGHYQQITNFIVGLANMQRIVAVDNFKLQNPEDTLANENPTLELDFEAITYRYATPEETKQAMEKSNAKAH